MNPDGTGVTRLTHSVGSDWLPAWSPDGTKIAFTSDREDPGCTFICNEEIYVMNADGGGQTRVTSNPASDLGPDWSPDGSKIAFESYRDGNYEVYVMNADGTGQTNLTNNPASDHRPAWSP
jgi:TolB protein